MTRPPNSRNKTGHKAGGKREGSGRKSAKNLLSKGAILLPVERVQASVSSFFTVGSKAEMVQNRMEFVSDEEREHDADNMSFDGVDVVSVNDEIDVEDDVSIHFEANVEVEIGGRDALFIGDEFDAILETDHSYDDNGVYGQNRVYGCNVGEVLAQSEDAIDYVNDDDLVHEGDCGE